MIIDLLKVLNDKEFHTLRNIYLKLESPATPREIKSTLKKMEKENLVVRRQANLKDKPTTAVNVWRLL